MSEHDDYEPHHASSPTDHVLSELQLYGYRPFTDEPDARPLPEGDHVAGAMICPPLSGPETMIVWTAKGTLNAEQEAQAGRDHRQAA